MSVSLNILRGRETFLLLLSTFRAAGRLSVNFCQISMPPGYLPSPTVNFRQFSVRQGDLLSTFHAAGNLSVNFRHITVWTGDLLSTSDTFPCGQRPSINFLCAGKPSVNFRQVSVWPGELLSISAKFLRCQKTFHQLSMCQETFSQLPLWLKDLSSTFREARRHSAACRAIGRPSVNNRKFSLRPGGLPSILSTFRAAGRPTFNFCQLSMRPGDLPSTLCQLSERLGDLPSTSVNFPCGQKSSCQLSGCE